MVAVMDASLTSLHSINSINALPSLPPSLIRAFCDPFSHFHVISADIMALRAMWYEA